jgi:hypothetical protein
MRISALITIEIPFALGAKFDSEVSDPSRAPGEWRNHYLYFDAKRGYNISTTPVMSGLEGARSYLEPANGGKARSP